MSVLANIIENLVSRGWIDHWDNWETTTVTVRSLFILTIIRQHVSAGPLALFTSTGPDKSIMYNILG